MTVPDISVGLVEDDPGTQERFRSALQGTAQLRLTYAGCTVGETVQWLRSNSVDVLLVDLGLPDGSGLEVIRQCRALCPATEIMVITLFGDEANMMRAFEAGARGYLLKDGTEDDLAEHVLSLKAGGSPMTPIIARQLLARL
ncbi:MAG: response regulator transcription factor, partial [Comamonadaceae bacterium]